MHVSARKRRRAITKRPVPSLAITVFDLHQTEMLAPCIVWFQKRTKLVDEFIEKRIKM